MFRDLDTSINKIYLPIPENLFAEYLTDFISKIIVEGYEIFLLVNTNKNIQARYLSRYLKKVGLEEIYFKKFSKIGLVSVLRGRE